MRQPPPDELPSRTKDPSGLRGLLGEPDRVVEVARGGAVFRRGDPADAIYEVRSGRIRLERSPEDGSLLVLGVLLPGDGLAEASVFARSYHCDAVAEVASRLAAYGRERVLAQLGARLRGLPGLGRPSPAASPGHGARPRTLSPGRSARGVAVAVDR